jgi:hypothetical protein
MKRLLLHVLPFLFCNAAWPQATLNFSGGTGSPITLELVQSVTYVMTASAPVGAPSFVFDGVGNVFEDMLPAATGSITFTINGGSPHPIFRINSGVTAGIATADDVYVYGMLLPLNVGDLVTLTAGTLTTTTDVALPAPGDGTFNTIITDGFGMPLSTTGVAIPEPGIGILTVIGALIILCQLCRMRRACGRHRCSLASCSCS